MTEKFIVEELMTHTPLALVVIGAVLLVIGAAGGGWPSLSLQVNEVGWRVILGVMGVMIAGIGGLLIWRETLVRHQDSTESLVSMDYDIKIISPQEGASVEGTVKISGTYIIKPPEGSVQLFNLSVDQRNYYPQQMVQFNPVKKTWTGESWVVSDTIVMVAIVGKSGRILCDYFTKVGTKTGSWHSLERLPDDIMECDRVWVRKTT